MRLQIPVNASSFFSRERRVQWEMVFHSALFPGLRHTVPAIADLLHLLQCLLTGMMHVEYILQAFHIVPRSLHNTNWEAVSRSP